ncbi:hypothetical protein G7Y89_g11965 [Cudoniella acicularis]|uniref:phosphoethanolamine N-methyltransferase n=1 Tax=Cudoniella acicularis TaxID=354080 RepID=A0A8H4VXH9_9HELO|nr:hypothetical protein G7Y89_g11965 [Cudoniella acicularis]
MAEQQEGFIEVGDEGFSDEGADLESNQSFLTSLSSSIVKGVEENGRTYATYGKEEYGLPMDEQEMDRIDMSHAKYYILLEKKAFPRTDSLRSATDFRFRVWNGTAPNCTFEIDDIEQIWTWKRESFDFIFARDLLLSIRDWPKLVNQCFTHLKPGGYVEFQSIFGELCCDDDSLPADSNFRQFDKYVRVASDKMGTPLTAPASYKDWFEAAGFVDVVEKKLKIPCNPWAKDPRLKMVGAFELDNFLYGLEAMSLRMFERGLGWSAEETRVFVAGVRKDIRNSRFHSYYPFYIVYGRKPDAGTFTPAG